VPDPLPTADWTAAPTRPATATPPAAGFDEEVRRLLRSRLILVHLLTLAFVALLIVLEVVIPRDASPRPADGPGWRLAVTLAASFAESLAGALALGRRPGMSVRSLRLWELALVATHTAYYGHYRFEVLAHAEGTSQEVGFVGLASLQGFITLILVYGVLVPNTRRRSLRVVAGLAAVAFAVIPAAAAVNPVLWAGHVPALAVQGVFILAVPAAIAVFAAARATALQRRAFEAERRAAERVGPYTLTAKLGAGGMGEVWLAEHRLLKRPCAVKFVRPDFAANPSAAGRFEREVRAVTALSHPNTVRVYDYGRADDGGFYYVMEYLAGPTLDALVGRAGPLPPGRAVYLVRQVCGALAEAHAAGLVHRDIKPGNILVASLGGQYDVAKLLDFGLVHDLAAGPDDGRLTRTGAVLGTPAYMAPEQAGGEAVTDGRGDLYSLGAVLFFAVTGRPPFDAPTVGKLVAAHLTRPPPRLTDLRPGLPADLAEVVARCLAKDPADRFQSAPDLDAALAGCGCAADWSAGDAARWWAAGETTLTPAGP
jgi:serine/threonine-protein kinase